MSEQKAVTVGLSRIEVAYERFIEPGAPLVLLIMGGGAQMIWWPDGFRGELAGRGMQVVRFDSRDTGRSTHFTTGPAPGLRAALAGDSSAAAYTLSDMAADSRLDDRDRAPGPGPVADLDEVRHRQPRGGSARLFGDRRAERGARGPLGLHRLAGRAAARSALLCRSSTRPGWQTWPRCGDRGHDRLGMSASLSPPWPPETAPEAAVPAGARPGDPRRERRHVRHRRRPGHRRRQPRRRTGHHQEPGPRPAPRAVARDRRPHRRPVRRAETAASGR